MAPWKRPVERLIPYDEALAALGKHSVTGDQVTDVLVHRIVGSVARADDFDALFRPRHRELRLRRELVGQAERRGPAPSPIRLIRLGELYFVLDGHHRISLAAQRGQREITACVQHVCTIAFGMGCLRWRHLASKAAEREFLERIPLDDAVRVDLWLDEPAQWMRLADAAEAWAFRSGPRVQDETRAELARRWWEQEVLPVVEQRRAAGTDVPDRDVEAYVAALLERDRRGTLTPR